MAPSPKAQLVRQLQASLRPVRLIPTVLSPPCGGHAGVPRGGGLPRLLQLLARAARFTAASAERNEISPEDARDTIEEVPRLPGVSARKAATELRRDPA